MKKAKLQKSVREVKKIEYPFPLHLRTSWTSNDTEQFTKVLNLLRAAFGSSTEPRDNEEPSEVVMGIKSVLQRVEKNCMSLLCVVACIDNGGDSGLLSRLVRNCYTNGVPIILGRGARELGSAFNKKRVCCVGLTKMAASRSELFDLVVDLSAVSSQVQVPLDEFDEIKEKFHSSCIRISSNGEDARKRKDPPTPVQKTNNSPPPKKANKTPQKKGNFFSSFD